LKVLVRIQSRDRHGGQHRQHYFNEKQRGIVVRIELEFPENARG
jgi:hypothetical protein